MKINNKSFFKSSAYLFTILFSLYCIFNLGLSYDQVFHIENGERRLKYLFSLGQYDYYDILHLGYYPGLYDTFASFITTAFPRTFYYESYYIVNFSIGLAGIFGLKKVVKFFFGSDTSKFFFFLAIFLPTYFGHLPINPKDTIIATAHFWILYYVIKYLKNDSNTIRKDSSIKIGFFLGLGVGVRVLFLGTLIPVFVFLLLELFLFKKITNNFRYKSFFYHFFLMFIISYALLILCWPNTHINILSEPFRIFIQSLNDSTQGVQVSYLLGKFYNTDETPWYYLAVNFFYKIPVIYLILFFSCLFLVKIIYNSLIKNYNFLYFFQICILFLFLPIFISIIFDLKIHDGLRYFLYLLPLFCIFPSIFLNYMFLNIKIRKIRNMFLFLLPFFIIFIVKFISITPYQYTYLNLFNDIFLDKNSFENDYWGSSSKELIKKFSKKIKKDELIKIATCGVNPNNIKYYLRKNNIKNFRIVSYDESYDYVVLVNRSISDNNNKYTCYSKFDSNNVFINITKNYIDLSKIVEY